MNWRLDVLITSLSEDCLHRLKRGLRQRVGSYYIYPRFNEQLFFQFFFVLLSCSLGRRRRGVVVRDVTQEY